MSNWILINEWGEGSKTYLDQDSIKINGATKQLWIKYYMEPPGKDKRTQKDVREMLMLEEYDCEKRTSCAHQIVFKYTDGSLSEPLSVEPRWAPVSGGNEITLRFLCEMIPAK